jgi:transposase
MPQLNDLQRSVTTLDQNGTLIAVIAMSQSSWLVAGVIPGVERHPLKKLEPDHQLHPPAPCAQRKELPADGVLLRRSQTIRPLQ